MPNVQYYALTQYDTSKENPFAVARYNAGVFERYRKGEWVIDNSLSAIFNGEFVEYEVITEAEAIKIINGRKKDYVQ